MKNYAVQYKVTTSYDTVVTAENKKEARNKVIEVIGHPVVIETVYEIEEKVYDA